MSAAISSIVEELKALPEDKLEEAANLIHMLKESAEQEIDPEWLEEIECRSAKIRSGKVKGIPLEQTLHELKNSRPDAR